MTIRLSWFTRYRGLSSSTWLNRPQDYHIYTQPLVIKMSRLTRYKVKRIILLYMNELLTRPSHICTQPFVIRLSQFTWDRPPPRYWIAHKTITYTHLPPLNRRLDNEHHHRHESDFSRCMIFILHNFTNYTQDNNHRHISHHSHSHVMFYLYWWTFAWKVLEGITFQYLYYILIILYRLLPKSFILFCCDTLSIIHNFLVCLFST